MGEVTSLLDLIGALFRFVGLEQNAWFPAIALVFLFFLIALPVSLLAQSRKVTTGNEGMIGQPGVALTDIGTEGTVYAHSEYWNAVSSIPIPKGTRVVVVSVDRMVLTVEPAK